MRVLFTDRDGVAWEVYEFGYALGRMRRYAIGTIKGLHRGFVRVDDPTVKRAVFLKTREQWECARRLSAIELQRELDASTPWRQSPNQSVSSDGS